MMVIAIDVDGTIADLVEEWLHRYNVDYDDDLTPGDITSWDTSQFVKPECGKKIFQYLNDPTLYDDVLPIKDSLEVIAALRSAGHRVFFATATNTNQMVPKMLWLERHGFVNVEYGIVCKDYIPVQDKSLIRADLLIDDGIHNLEVFVRRKILFSQPWNKSDSEYPRACSWKSVARLLGVNI
jgi:5'-nucleotidase